MDLAGRVSARQSGRGTRDTRRNRPAPGAAATFAAAQEQSVGLACHAVVVAEEQAAYPNPSEAGRELAERLARPTDGPPSRCRAPGPCLRPGAMDRHLRQATPRVHGDRHRSHAMDGTFLCSFVGPSPASHVILALLCCRSPPRCDALCASSGIASFASRPSFRDHQTGGKGRHDTLGFRRRRRLFTWRQ